MNLQILKLNNGELCIGDTRKVIRVYEEYTHNVTHEFEFEEAGSEVCMNIFDSVSPKNIVRGFYITNPATFSVGPTDGVVFRFWHALSNEDCVWISESEIITIIGVPNAIGEYYYNETYKKYRMMNDQIIQMINSGETPFTSFDNEEEDSNDILGSMRDIID